MPPTFILVCLLDAVNKWSHTLVIVAIWFHHVYDVEPVGAVFSCVLYAEIVPLGVPCCAVVVFQVKIIFSVRYFNGTAQVTRLKSRFKHESVVFSLTFQLVVGWQVFIISV